MRLKPLRHRAVLLSLLLFVSIVGSAFVSPVHAGNNIVFDFATGAGTSDPTGGIACGGGCTGAQTYPHAVVAAELVVWEVAGPAGGGLNCASLTFSDSQSDVFTIQGCQIIATGSGNAVQELVTGFITSTGTDTFTANSGGSNVQYFIVFTAYKFVAQVVGFNSQYLTGVTDVPASNGALSPLVQTNAGDLIVGSFAWTATGGIGTNIGTVRSNAGFTGFRLGLDDVVPSVDTWVFGNGPTGNVSHMVFDMQPGFVGDTNFVTQCFGNCGTPAVTLANTVSSSTVNFNQSITLFYIFQSTLSGFVQNVTVNLGKNYPNSLNAPFLALYFANCPIGTPAFTSQCPGVQYEGVNTGAFNKGIVSMTSGFQYGVFIGEWVGIAVSSQYSGTNLNDTNTGVAMSQTNGLIPSSISQYTTFNTGSLIGLWAWVTGATAQGAKPPFTPTTCFGIDCILTNVVNSFCQNVTVSCQTASSMFWVIILTLVSIFVMAFMFNQIVPSLNLGRVGLSEMSVLIFVMWVAIFTSFSLMSLYVMAIIFSIAALMLGRKVNSVI